MFDNIRVMVDAFTSDPMNLLVYLLYTIVVILTSLILHEYAQYHLLLDSLHQLYYQVYEKALM